jgi:sugar (pentulose or hexulose) kinase
MAFIGVDVGTSSLKAVLLEPGPPPRVVGEASRPYDPERRPVRDPELWARLAVEAIREVAAGTVPEGIGFTGQMHSLIATDAAGRVIDPVLLWLDMHGADDLVSFIRAHGIDLVARTGNLPLPDFTLAKWLYGVRTEPRMTDARMLWCAKDFVRWRIDPSSPPSVDPNEATGMQLRAPTAEGWDADLLACAGLSAARLPVIRPGDMAVGTAAGLGWPDVPLVLGVGDQAAAARAVGSHRPGTASLSLGTSGVLSAAAAPDRLPAHWDAAFHLFPHGYGTSYQVIGTVPGLGEAFGLLSRLLDRPVEAIDALAGETAPGSGTALFFPYLRGSGAPHPNHAVRGELASLDGALTRAGLVRSVYDGIAMEIRCLVDEVAALGIPVDEVVLSGGGARQPAFVETLAAFLGRPALTVETRDASATGAALLAVDHVRPGLDIVLERRALQPRAAARIPERWLARRSTLVK